MTESKALRTKADYSVAGASGTTTELFALTAPEGSALFAVNFIADDGINEEQFLVNVAGKVGAPKAVIWGRIGTQGSVDMTEVTVASSGGNIKVYGKSLTGAGRFNIRMMAVF